MKHQFCFILKISYLAAHKSEVYMFWDINIEKLKRDNHSHGECVFNAYSKEMYVFAYSVMGGKVESEDNVQDFWGKLWPLIHYFCQRFSFRFYCHTSIYRMSLNVLRTK